MAEYTKTLSGGSASSQYRIRMVVTESDVNINNNTSKVNVTAYIDKLKGTGYFSNDGKPWNIKIDGTTVASGNKTYNFTNYTTLTLGSGSKTITHNSDGSKSVAVSAYFSSSPYLGSATVSATFNLTTIARASSISSITGSSELNQSVTVNISRKSNSFTHKVEYSYAGSSYITASTSAGDTCSFTPSISLASYVPNSTSGTLTVRVTTYNGSTQIGSSVTATKTLSVPSSVVPTMGTPSVTRIDNGVPSSWGVYVQSFSKAMVSMTSVAGAYGSTIKSYSITGGGLNANTSSATTGVLSTSGTITFTCTVIDSRGRSVSKPASINVVAYSPPSLSLVAERSDASGTPNATAGTCAKVTATFSFASVSGKNSIDSKSCSCNGQTNTTFESGTPFVLNANLSIGASYTVSATIEDALGRSSGTITVSISSAKRIINVKANKNGMAIGKFAENDEELDVAWNFRVRGNINDNLKMSRGKAVTTNLGSASWIYGRDVAVLKRLNNPGSGWGALTSSKTENGTFETGTIYNQYTIAYASDANYNSKVNTTTNFTFYSDGTFNAPKAVTSPTFNGKATSAGYLTDRYNGTATYLNYGAAAVASASYFAAWNGYELRAMTPTNVRNTISANALNRTVVTLWSGSVQSGTFSVSNMDRYRMLAILPGTSSGSYATWLIIPCQSNTNQLRGVGAYNAANIELYTSAGTRSASSISMTEIGVTKFYNNQYPKYTRLYFKQIVGIY